MSPGAILKSGSELWFGLQPGTVMRSVASVIIRCHGTFGSLYYYLGSCRSSGTTLLLGPTGYDWAKMPPGAMVIPRPKLLGLAISGTMIPLQLWSVLMFIAHVTTGP